MANEKGSKPEAGKVELNKEPAKGQNATVGQPQNIENSGDKKVTVNPLLDTEKVTIPHSIDESGNVVADHFYPGKSYDVSAELLGAKNTEGVSYFVEVDDK